MNRERMLLQGAMDIEIQELLSAMRLEKTETHAGFSYYIGEICGVPVIVNKTGMGIISGVLATMTAISNYRIKCVINQGTAGGHADWVHTGDLIRCEKAEYLNGLRMPVKGAGEGADSLQWRFDEKMKPHCADSTLLKRIEGLEYPYGKSYTGCIGSGDIYSREVDRIRWIQGKKGNLCEDMETYGVYETCERMKVPCLGLRVISNHEVFGEPFSEETAALLQKYLILAIEKGILA